MIRIAAPLIAIALMGCAAQKELPTANYGIPLPPTPCGAENFSQFVGKQRSDAVTKQVAEQYGATGIRWIEPGMAVTMDYRENRLNVRLDDKGVILSFDCG